MNERATTISVAPRTAELLRAKAAWHQLSLDDYLRQLAEADVARPSAPAKLEEFDRDMDELAAGLDKLPVLAADFSRVDLYADHD